jgi:chemotaxis protein histidine kinase CheA
MSTDVLINEFIADGRSKLEGIEADLLAFASQGNTSGECANRIFNAVHAIKSAAAFLQLHHIVAVGQSAEAPLSEILARPTYLPSSDAAKTVLEKISLLDAIFWSDNLGLPMDDNDDASWASSSSEHEWQHLPL